VSGAAGSLWRGRWPRSARALLGLRGWTAGKCTFEEKMVAAGDGGGFHTWDVEETLIKNSVFESNSGWSGAGFFASGLGSPCSLEVPACGWLLHFQSQCCWLLS